MATANLIKAITVGVRYSAVRRQFGPDDSNEELPVIEYQLQVNNNVNFVVFQCSSFTSCAM